MGPIPDDVLAQFAPMPADFAPPITANGKAFIWRGRVPMVSPGRHLSIHCEYGLPKSMGHTATELRGMVWKIMELGRLGREDLLRFARPERHDGHPVSVPEIPPIEDVTAEA